jgi:hypothetical protein
MYCASGWNTQELFEWGLLSPGQPSNALVKPGTAQKEQTLRERPCLSRIFRVRSMTAFICYTCRSISASKYSSFTSLKKWTERGSGTDGSSGTICSPITSDKGFPSKMAVSCTICCQPLSKLKTRGCCTREDVVKPVSATSPQNNKMRD